MASFSLSEATLNALLAQWLWPLLRVAGFVMAAPIIGTRALPVRLRVILVLALTSVIAPNLAAPDGLAPLSGPGLLAVAQQVLVGATIGLVLRMVFMAFEFAGQFIAQQAGLGFAAMVDPASGSQVPVLAHLYTILASMIFFAADAHLVLIKLLGDSFTLVPVGPQGLTAEGAGLVVEWAGTLFAAALVMSLPVIIALLTINLAFGVMTRAAPQLNIISIGFPVLILAAMMVALLTLDDVRTTGLALFDAAFLTLRQVLEAR